ncbi:histidine kinase [Spirosoma liriopis]|uniref:histidine kinase n=1 Tax=Spirosoma liriopis TaxID=2937440 RepID=UPI0020BE94DC
MERPNDKWLRRFAIPLAVLLANLLSLPEKEYDWQQYVIWSAVEIGYATLIWQVILYWLLYIRRRYSSINRTRRRVILTFGGYFVITASAQALIIGLSDVTGVSSIPINVYVYGKFITVGLVWVILVGTVYEVIYYVQKYREALQETEALKKVSIQQQYDRLKNQVNPHFLFNSLNSLSALITEDRDKASIFLDELSSVYRYLLQAGQRTVVTLQDELTFLTAYQHLLNTRFGNAIRWDIQVDKQFLDLSIPPLTLQTLIENALRHNLLLVEQPLTLRITVTDDGHLLVSNRLQRKKLTVATQQGGLSKLSSRFDDLGLPRPLIEDDGKQFTVCIPLVRLTQSQENVVTANP